MPANVEAEAAVAWLGAWLGLAPHPILPPASLALAPASTPSIALPPAAPAMTARRVLQAVFAVLDAILVRLGAEMGSDRVPHVRRASSLWGPVAGVMGIPTGW